MISLDKASAYIFYKNNPIEAFEKDPKKKFKGVFIYPITTSRDFLVNLFDCKILKYIMLNIRGVYYSKRFFINTFGLVTIPMVLNKITLRNQSNYYKWLSKICPRINCKYNIESKYAGKSYIKETLDEINRLMKIRNSFNAVKFNTFFLPYLDKSLKDIWIDSTEDEKLYPHRYFLIDTDNEMGTIMLDSIKTFIYKYSKKAKDIDFSKFIFVSCKNNYFVKLDNNLVTKKSALDKVINIMSKYSKGNNLDKDENKLVSINIDKDLTKEDLTEEEKNAEIIEDKAKVELEERRERILTKILARKPSIRSGINSTFLAKLDDKINNNLMNKPSLSKSLIQKVMSKSVVKTPPKDTEKKNKTLFLEPEKREAVKKEATTSGLIGMGSYNITHIKNNEVKEKETIAKVDPDSKLVKKYVEKIDEEPVEEPTEEEINDFEEEKLIKEMEQEGLLLSKAEEESLRLQEEEDKKQKEIVEKLLKNQNEAIVELSSGDKLRFEDIAKFEEPSEIESFDTNIKSIKNTELERCKLANLNSQYIQKQLLKDSVEIFASLNNDSERPLYIDRIKVEDNSDSVNKIETVNVTYKDTKNKKYEIKIDIPKTTPEGYLYINGSKKAIEKQLLGLPILKTQNDRVQITTFYNKTFIYRKGTKSSKFVENLIRFLKNSKSSKIHVSLGNASFNNKEHFSVYFESLANEFTFIRFKESKAIFGFSFNEMENLLQEIHSKSLIDIYKKYENAKVYALYNNKIYFMFYDNGNIAYKYYDISKKTIVDTNETEDSFNLIINLIKNTDEKLFTELSKTSSGTAYTYAAIKMVSKLVPVGIILAYKDGFNNTLKRIGLESSFSTSRKNLTEEEKTHKDQIKFKDGYFYYDTKNKLFIEMIMNGIKMMDTEDIAFNDMEKKEVYFDYFEDYLNSRNVGKGFKNFYERFIDPVTFDILKSLNQPTEFSDILVYCCKLLEDKSATRANDIKNYRIRSEELISQILYKTISDAFNSYKSDTISAGERRKMVVKRDAVIKALTASQNVEAVSLLSPISEVEFIEKITFKGTGGINLDDAFKNNYRAYDKSMQSVLSPYTPYTGTAGVVRSLAYNTRVKNIRGILDIDSNTENPTELLSTIELMNPFLMNHSDPPRVAMASTQNKHLTPTFKSDRPLICSGVQKVIPKIIGNDFCFKARMNGKIEKIDNKNEIAIITYDNGTKDVIDLKSKLTKNVKSGFFIECKLTLLKKVGYKFKAGEILAYDNSFFKPSTALSGENGEIELCNGTLTKVAMVSDSNTFEDSCIVTEKMVDDMKFNVVLDKSISLSPNTNISKMVKVGDEIKASDTLMVFETGYDEKEVSEVLRRLGDEMGNEIIDIGRNSISSKISGKIVDIEIFYNKEISEFSPSIQKIIKDYIKTNKDRQNIAEKVSKDTILSIHDTNKIEYNQINGEDIDGIIIKFYISHTDYFKCGDKVAFETALKTICSKVIPNNEAPNSEYRPDEHIDAIFSPLSVISRMTTDVYYKLYTNKILVELKKQCKEIAGL